MRPPPSCAGEARQPQACFEPVQQSGHRGCGQALCAWTTRAGWRGRSSPLLPSPRLCQGPALGSWAGLPAPSLWGQMFVLYEGCPGFHPSSKDPAPKDGGGAESGGSCRVGEECLEVGAGLREGSLHLGDNSLAIQLFQKGAIFSCLSIRLFIANRVTGVEGWGGRPALAEALGGQSSASGPAVEPLLGFPGPRPRPGVVGQRVNVCAPV